MAELEAEVANQEAMDKNDEHYVTLVLKQIMDTFNLTQAQLAKRLGWPAGTVAQYAAGRSVNPSWDFLARLVTRFGCDPRKLFPDHGSFPEGDESKGEAE